MRPWRFAMANPEAEEPTEMQRLDWYGRAIGVMALSIGALVWAVATFAPNGTAASTLRLDGFLTALAGWAL